MRRFSVLLPALLAILVGASPATAWTWPVDGPVLQPFSFGDDPYAAGLHRGIDIGAPEGSPVRAPAAGSVSFAGTVPAGGRTVTIRTADGYAVTLVHLGSISVGRGTTIAEGGPVGTIGPTGEPELPEPYVHLGIRIASKPEGYVDPLSLLPGRSGGGGSSLPAAPAEDGRATTDPSASDAGLADADDAVAPDESPVVEPAAEAAEAGGVQASQSADAGSAAESRAADEGDGLPAGATPAQAAGQNELVETVAESLAAREAPALPAEADAGVAAPVDITATTGESAEVATEAEENGVTTAGEAAVVSDGTATGSSLSAPGELSPPAESAEAAAPAGDEASASVPLATAPALPVDVPASEDEWVSEAAASSAESATADGDSEGTALAVPAESTGTATSNAAASELLGAGAEPPAAETAATEITAVEGGGADGDADRGADAEQPTGPPASGSSATDGTTAGFLADALDAHTGTSGTAAAPPVPTTWSSVVGQTLGEAAADSPLGVPPVATAGVAETGASPAEGSEAAPRPTEAEATAALGQTTDEESEPAEATQSSSAQTSSPDPALVPAVVAPAAIAGAQAHEGAAESTNGGDPTASAQAKSDRRSSAAGAAAAADRPSAAASRETEQPAPEEARSPIAGTVGRPTDAPRQTINGSLDRRERTEAVGFGNSRTAMTAAGSPDPHERERASARADGDGFSTPAVLGGLCGLLTAIAAALLRRRRGAGGADRDLPAGPAGEPGETLARLDVADEPPLYLVDPPPASLLALPERSADLPGESAEPNENSGGAAPALRAVRFTEAGGAAAAVRLAEPHRNPRPRPPASGARRRGRPARRPVRNDRRDRAGAAA